MLDKEPWRAGFQAFDYTHIVVHPQSGQDNSLCRISHGDVRKRCADLVNFQGAPLVET